MEMEDKTNFGNLAARKFKVMRYDSATVFMSAKIFVIY